MSQAHDRMIAALKEFVVPKLRERGFKGSFPHFRRPGQEKIDLLTFQFDQRGGGFVIEISSCSLDGITTYFGDHIPPNRVTVWDMHTDKRYRLQHKQGLFTTSDWFRYDGPIQSENVFEKTAKQVLQTLQQAEKWWNE